jgi:tol-pal system protein YbgF
MQIFKSLIFLTVACSNLLTSIAFAQVSVQVVDAGNNQGQVQGASDNNSQNETQNEVMINMYLQLEALQSEIQNLRGLVDEQSYQIRRMQTEQRDRYLDTDSRLSEINNQMQSFHNGQQAGVSQIPPATTPLPGNINNSGNPGNQAGSNPAVNPGGNGLLVGATVAVNTPQSEQELYRAALNLLLEDEAFAESISLFQQYIEGYPQGRYLTNSLYWQGAAMELAGRYPQAIVVLQRLINEFPADPKAPTAILRLGTVYREMGDNSQAAMQWRKISELYPESTSEIEIANEYLSDITN